MITATLTIIAVWLKLAIQIWGLHYEP